MKQNIFLSLLQLLMIFCALFLLFSGITAITSLAFTSGFMQNTATVKTLQMISQIMTFLGTAIIFLKTNKIKIKDYWGIDAKISMMITALIVLLFFVDAPFVSWLSDVGSKIKFSGKLGIWQQNMEQITKTSEDIVNSMINTKSFPSFLGNLLVIGFVPAVCEEAVFRGCVQKLLTDRMKNIHIAIILSSIIFSAVHVDIQNSLARIVLGMLLGYIFFYTKDIKMSMLLHFINNSGVIITAYYNCLTNNCDEGKTMTSLFENPFAITASLILIVAIIVVMRKLSIQNVSSGCVVTGRNDNDDKR